MIFIEPFIHWIHLMAAVTWAGGMVFTAFVLGPVARKEIPPQIRYPLFQKIGVRFSKIGWGALLLLIATGFYKIIRAWESWDFFLTSYGIALLIKLGLVCAVILLSLLHDFRWGPKLARFTAQERDSAEYKKNIFRLTFWARVNVGLVLLIIGIAAWLRMNPF